MSKYLKLHLFRFSKCYKDIGCNYMKLGFTNNKYCDFQWFDMPCIENYILKKFLRLTSKSIYCEIL